MVNVALVGSTGSIGRQALNVIRRHSDRFRLVLISASSSTDLLASQYHEFLPDYVGVYEQASAHKLEGIIPKGKLVVGQDALTVAASLSEVDIVVVAVSGMIGLVSLEAAIKSNKRIALANKESLVSGGEIVLDLLKDSRASIIPIDSEHSAIMQCIAAGRKEDINKLILTASGGPFYGKAKSDLERVTPLEAVKHPTWSMGTKISIDSATMMNKALEIIEARYLFDTTKIEYIIHPESIIHSMVEFCDGTVISQMGIPNMEAPIQYALSLPVRLNTDLPPLKLTSLTFKEPDEAVFPAPKLAKYCIEQGFDLPCRFNAANEAAVSLFLKGKIRFDQIYDIVEQSVLGAPKCSLDSTSDVFDCYHDTVNKIYASLDADKIYTRH